MIERQVERHITNTNIGELPLFLSLKNQTPAQENKKIFESKKAKILQEFKNLEDSKRKKLESLFSRFVYDPGAKDDFVLTDEQYERLSEADPTFKEKVKKGVKIYSKRSLISIAESAILSGQRVALVKFDVNYLRLVDKAGYADFSIRDLSAIMNKIAEKYKNKGVIAARTGGDTFCFFLSSKTDINIKFLKQLQQEVTGEFSHKKAYYMIDESRNLILKSKAKIKNEPDSIILANRSGDPEKILRTLVSGRIPDAKDLYKKAMTNAEYIKIKKTIEQRQSAHKLGRKKDVGKTLRTFIIDHPELDEQNKLLRELIDSGKGELAEYLLSYLESYYIDPLLDEQVFQGADFFRHLQSREKLYRERIVYVYFPWLKNMNTDLGEAEVDVDIQKIYKDMGSQEFSQNPGRHRLPRARKDGGDFIFLSSKFAQQEVIYVDSTNINEKSPFRSRFPVFLATVDYPEANKDLGQTIENMKSMGKAKFVDWLNNLYEINEESASSILDYYLQDRTEDRCRELQLIIGSFQSVSKKFSEKIESELKKVAGKNQEKIYKDFGITPLRIK